MSVSYKPGLEAMRNYFESRVTLPYAFRRQQLQQLKTALLAHEQEIYDALRHDLGKSREEAYLSELGLLLSEINLLLRNLKAWMKPRKAPTSFLHFPSRSTLYRDPLGVVLIIAPWNYPLQLVLLPLAGAIAAGNCIVLKPSELAPATSTLIHKIISSAFDKNYVMVAEGEGATVINDMMETFRFDHILYTGSTQVGTLIYKKAAEQLVPVTLELGGKSPCIVEADANIETAAQRIVFGKFLNLGQTCIAPDYLLVHHSARQALVAALKDTIQKFYSLQPENSYDYGKIINLRRFNTLVAYLENAKILHGGQHDREKLYIAPTLIEGAADAPVMQEEIFGPILPVFEFDSFEDAEALLKKHPAPLAFYIFSESIQKQQRWINNTAFGGGCINNTVVQFSNPALPFGGVGTSGFGKYHGKYSFDSFSRLKPVLKTATWLDLSLKYPPYKGRLNWFKKILG